MVQIEVAYAAPERVVTKTYEMTLPATLSDALARAMADPDFAGVDIANASVGVFGLLARREQPLLDGDRVEIYRPLAVDPKTARRARAKNQR
jgi:putative ubiquitin-RnfH superfamily antitoxin RatB of RatAB toxin-antitoxin module